MTNIHESLCPLTEGNLNVVAPKWHVLHAGVFSYLSLLQRKKWSCYYYGSPKFQEFQTHCHECYSQADTIIIIMLMFDSVFLHEN